jgi:hypothetical protein
MAHDDGRTGPVSARFESRVAGPPAAITRWAAVAVVLLAILVVKPWAGGASRDGPPDGPAPEVPSPRPPVASRTPRPSATPPSVADVAMAAWCLGPATWRTVSSESWRDRSVRVWRALDPIRASGPLDPRIEAVPLAGLRVDAAGFCAPVVGPEAPRPPIRVDAWRLHDPETAERLHLVQLVPRRGQTAFGRLWAPPGADDPQEASDGWPQGRYVVRVEDVVGSEWWWGFEIDDLVAAAP